MKGWVYIMQNRAMQGILKVGFSTKHPELRASELDSTGLPFKFDVKYAVLVNDPYSIEQNVHAELSLYHENKEFFRVDLNTAIQAIKNVVLNTSNSIFYEETETELGIEDSKLKNYEILAKQGNLEALSWLGHYYCFNEDSDLKPSYKIGLQYIATSIKGGFKQNIHRYGTWHMFFDEPFTDDTYYEDEIDYIYYSPDDCDPIFEALKTIAAKGDTDAQFYVGNILAYGTVIPINLEAAYYWLNKAAVIGNIEAKRNADDIAFKIRQKK